jgi:cytochrome b561
MKQHYNGPAKALHWLTAGLILTAFPLGVYMHDLPLSPTKLQLYSYHKWIGITALLIAVLRVIWRVSKGAPAALPGPAWQQKAASLTHGLLYVLMFAVPLSGWLMSSAKGFPVVYFGVLPLPDLVGKSQDLGDFLRAAHEFLNFSLIALVGLHLGAALKHQFIDRDETLVRMSPLPSLAK